LPVVADHAKELAEQKDRYLRLSADFDNFRKRTVRDAEQRAASEKESFIHELLPILDNLERALSGGYAHAHSFKTLHQGVEMTRQLMLRLLHSHGIEPVVDEGQPFDPHRHEALSLRPDAERPDQTILEVVRRGYRCGQKVFRPAQVIVSEAIVPPGVARAG
jgi:molecular chaperone GrpE